MKHLVTIGFESWPPENCAEVDAIQQAITDGVELENAHMFTVQHKNNNFIPKAACLNCTASFGSSIRDRNYSGWSNEALENKHVFEDSLKNGYVNFASKMKTVRNMESKDDINSSDMDKAMKSYEAINTSRNNND